MASRAGSTVKDPTATPTGHRRHVPPPRSSARRAVPETTIADEGARGQAILRGLALAVLAHEATTSGRGHATEEGHPTTPIGVDLSAAVTPTRWAPPVRLPVATPQAASPSSIAHLGCEEDDADPPLAFFKSNGSNAARVEDLVSKHTMETAATIGPRAPTACL